MSDLREQIAKKINYYYGKANGVDDLLTADEIISLVRADYEQKVIEAVENERKQPTAQAWEAVADDIIDGVIEAIKQVMADGE